MLPESIRRFSAGAAFFALVVAGCEGQFSKSDPALLKAGPENGGPKPVSEDFSQVPVPPADGPLLVPLALSVSIRAKPALDSAIVGVLRVGARVPRSTKPVTFRDCPGGWFAVRPLGFVCAGPQATLNLDHPIARALGVEPDRKRPMPYKYAFLRAVAPNYMRIPTTDEQFRHEMRLERHLKNWKKFRESWDELDVGANDVPLDEKGLAIGRIPDHARPMDESERFGGNGDDRVPWWLQGERRIANLASFKVPGYAVISNRIKRHAGVALIGSFVSGENGQKRRFAISTDARLIPADKLKADSGSPFHGFDIRKTGLPVAFARTRDARAYQLVGTRFQEGDRLEPRELISLTGNVRVDRRDRMVEARDGRWLKSAELGTVIKPSSLPAFARKGSRWIDISISNQTLTLWEGDTPVYVTLVSTGRDGSGDPEKTLSTPQGLFRVFQKHVTTTMDSSVADQEFELRDVPWVMYFKGGYALHGAYWHDDFGRPRSHGCVNLSPIDARFVFFWSSPSVPEHWHAAYAGDQGEPGTIVNIHP